MIESVEERVQMSEENKKPASVDELETGMELRGVVKRIELYGAFVDIGVGRDGLLHISQLGKPNVRNVEDVVKTGDEVTVYVLKVDRGAGKVQLSLERPPAVSWTELKEGTTITGKVARLENFGAFVDIGAERLAMIHVSELSNGFVKSPADVVKVGDEITAQIIKIDPKKKRIDLSLKVLTEQVERTKAKEARQAVKEEEAESEPVPTAMALALQQAMKDSGDSFPTRGGKREDRRNNKRDRREREQRDMEDIFERTLRGGR
jgi:ribosomal protein S1